MNATHSIIAGLLACSTSLAAGCATSSDGIRNYQPEVGARIYVRAPAQQVVTRLPEALQAAQFSLVETYQSGPPVWNAIAKLSGGLTGDGQWARITVRAVKPDLTLVYAICGLRGGGVLGEDPSATARNILVNVLVLNAPEAQGPKLDALRHAALQPLGVQP
jgi:hypothetical protein